MGADLPAAVGPGGTGISLSHGAGSGGESGTQGAESGRLGEGCAEHRERGVIEVEGGWERYTNSVGGRDEG